MMYNCVVKSKGDYMKKFVMILLAFALMMSFGIQAFAAEGTEISLKKYSSEEGNIVVDVDLSEKGNPCMIQFCLAYDSDVLEFVSFTAGSVLSGNMTPTINQMDGKVYFVWDTLTPLQTGGTLLRIEFSPKAEGKDASVWIDTSEEFIVANENFEEIGSIKGKLEFKTPSSEKTEVPPEELPPAENVPDEEEQQTGGMEIDKTEVSVGVNSEAEITVNNTEKEVFWYSSDENVARVEDGKIIPVGPGTATITAITEDGMEEESCVVTVTEDDLPGASGEENVLNVDSPRAEKEEGIPGWAMAMIIVLALGAAVLLFIIIFKIKTKRSEGSSKEGE